MKKIFLTLLSIGLLACEGLHEGLNKNPNFPTDVPSTLLLKGAILADVTIQAGHLQRISGIWNGHFIGAQSLYKSLGEYNFTTEESNTIWFQIYTGVVNQTRKIEEENPDNALLQGICGVLEAHAVGTAVAIFGDIPYSEAWNRAIDIPKFDSQKSIYAALQSRLDKAITSLTGASGAVSEDIIFTGKAASWIAVANTLKARYYLHTKEYDKAKTAAGQGIDSKDESMIFKPPAVAGNGDANLLNQVVTSGARAGDLVTQGTFLMDLLDTSKSSSRNNAKTDETARRIYYSLDGGNVSTGASAPKAPHRLVTYEENLLILAETEARSGNFTAALGHLNEVRKMLAAGDIFTKVNAAHVSKYDALVEADFNPNGIENKDNIAKNKALLREIIEERYVIGYNQFMPFNDARRLRKSDKDVSVPFPTVTGSKHPERFVISQNEVNANTNAKVGTIFDVTEVNQ